MTIPDLLTQCFGFSVPVHRGEIDLQPMGNVNCPPVIICWRRNGIRNKQLEAMLDELNFEWLMIDASHNQEHLQAVGAKDN